MTASFVKLYGSDGSLVTTYQLPTVTSFGLELRTFQIVERDGDQVVCYSGATDSTPADDAGSATIYAYNLTTLTALTPVDVRARVTDGVYLRVDSLTALSNGKLVACWTETDTNDDPAFGTRSTIRVYDTSDEVELTYVLPVSTATGGACFADLLASSTVLLSSPDTSSDFWVRQLTVIGDGAIAREMTIPRSILQPSPGEAQQIPDIMPIFQTSGQRFDVSSSPGSFTGEGPIVWMRQSPHNISAGRRLFFGRVELLVDVGAGGANATVTQQYSNDGGQTWGNGVTRSLGAAGETFQRVFWPVNGSGRDRVWRWYGQGNAPVRLVDVWVDTEKGTS